MTGQRYSMRVSQSRWGLLLTLPAWVLLLALYIVPVLTLLALALTDYEMGAVTVRWVGLDNYLHAWNDPVFRRSLVNTLIYMLCVVPASVAGGLLIALLVHARNKTRSFFEVIYFLPVTSTLIAMATVWQFLLHPKLGPVNTLLKALGLQSVNFLSEPALMIPTLAGIGVWQLLGFNMILFLTGLSNIPRDLYDAGAVDGITHEVDRFFRITLPMLGPTLLFVVVTTTISAFKVFDTVAVLTQGRNGSEVMLYDIYLEGFSYSRTGYAAALTLVFLALILLLAAWQSTHMEKKMHYT